MSAREVRPLPPEVRGWPREWIDRFIERAGIHLDSGVRPALADQRAWLEVARMMRGEA